MGMIGRVLFLCGVFAIVVMIVLEVPAERNRLPEISLKKCLASKEEHMPLIIKGMYLDESKPLTFTRLSGRDYDEVCIAAARLTRQGAKLLEWQMGGFAGLHDEAEVRKTLESLRGMTDSCVLLATVRTAAQGGQVAVGADQLVRIYDQIAQSHCADLIDVEYQTVGEDIEPVMEQLRERGAMIALSYGVKTADVKDDLPEEKWKSVIQKMAAADPDVIRLVDGERQLWANGNTTSV